jgi:hypothetical protein
MPSWLTPISAMMAAHASASFFWSGSGCSTAAKMFAVMFAGEWLRMDANAANRADAYAQNEGRAPRSSP